MCASKRIVASGSCSAAVTETLPFLMRSSQRSSPDRNALLQIPSTDTQCLEPHGMGRHAQVSHHIELCARTSCSCSTWQRKSLLIWQGKSLLFLSTERSRRVSDLYPGSSAAQVLLNFNMRCTHFVCDNLPALFFMPCSTLALGWQGHHLRTPLPAGRGSH